MIEVEAGMESAQNTVAVNLGTFRQKVEETREAGAYASTDEVIQAALLALERERPTRTSGSLSLPKNRFRTPGRAFRQLRFFES